MVDFVKLLRDDFINGSVVFIGSKENAADIAGTLFAGEQTPRFVIQNHPYAHSFIISSADAHADWEGQSPGREEFAGYVTIPWETTTQMINSLNNDDIDTIVDMFLKSSAYININQMDEDVEDAIDIIGAAADKDGIEYDADADEIEYEDANSSYGATYIRSLYGDYYPNLFVDNSLGSVTRRLNASNAFGVGVGGSVIRPSVVYPIAYIAKKISDKGNNTSYTEEDFDEIFN